MKKAVVFFIVFVCNSLILCSCGPAIQDTVITGIDETIQPYVDMYKADKLRFLGTTNIKTISIVFRSLKRPTVGQCTQYGNGKKVIEIDPVYWFFSIGETERKVLLYHELGHCDLGKSHRENEIAIMNAILMNDYQYILNEDYYIEQLFRK